MNYINVDIPILYCFVRKEFLYDLAAHKGEFEPVSVFGIRSVGGRALGFHALTSNGAQIAGLPIHSLCWNKRAPRMPLDFLELWECFGEYVGVQKFDFLSHAASRCRIILKDKTWIEGSYMFTVDWCKNSYSDEPSMAKSAHIIKLDNGNFAAQPNNRVLWFDPCTVVSKERPDYKVNTHVWKCETQPKWVTEDSDRFFYDYEEIRQSATRRKPNKNGSRRDVLSRKGKEARSGRDSVSDRPSD
jgi:hypothetical protein